jgi:hypothetical protein
MSTSPTVHLADAENRDIFDLLESCEKLLTAREVARILSISEKNRLQLRVPQSDTALQDRGERSVPGSGPCQLVKATCLARPQPAGRRAKNSRAAHVVKFARITMAPGLWSDRISSLAETLRSRQMKSGGWAYFDSVQESLEATCLAELALAPERHANSSEAILFLLKSQLSDGGWPAFLGDSEGSWTTALALCTLNSTGDFTAAREKAFRWLYAERGREGHWFWRWKFKTSDRNVRFDPDKYGWPWVTGSASWVIPTAFSIIAIEQFTVCNRSEESEKRIHLGVEMLLDRECVDGGWNLGNSLVYGVPLRPHVEATAIALLALQDEQRIEMVQKSLSWLRQNAASVDSVSSLAWCILTLFVYQESVEPLKNRLATIMGDGREVRNNATLATALLALKCGEMIHPFVVLR